jgi:hypothetical protein
VCIRLRCARVPPWSNVVTYKWLSGGADYRVYRLMYCEHIGDGPCSPRSPGGFAMYSELIALADD